MKVLVVGNGGREHALAWKIAQSKKLSKLFIAPGNPGTALCGENVAMGADDIDGLKAFALKQGIDLTVVGPELPLTLGIVDSFVEAGLKIFGPTKRAAILEGSKVFSKELMAKYDIPTAKYKKFTDPAEAKKYAEDHYKNTNTDKETNTGLVIKADGLAAGKGVLICPSMEEAFAAIDLIMKVKSFGEAGDSVIIEDCLTGEEASLLAITDGETILPLAPAQDHKPIFDDDKGPNTGGMGAYSPAPVLTETLLKEVMEDIMVPTVRAMREEGRPYKGILYAGLMIQKGKAKTNIKVKVLEFNCRFGDPEAQPILMRLESDLLDVLLASIEGTLDKVNLKWDPRASVCVVMSSEGYPGDYEKGRPITGLDDITPGNDVVVFHAGTAEKDGCIVTSGGRVLGVTGLGSGIAEAIEETYRAVEKIDFEGAYYRGDIGAKALLR